MINKESTNEFQTRNQTDIDRMLQDIVGPIYKCDQRPLNKDYPCHFLILRASKIPESRIFYIIFAKRKFVNATICMQLMRLQSSSQIFNWRT